MKKIIWILTIIIVTKFSFAQTEIKGTMGINFISIPSAQDYINQNHAPNDAQLNTFNTAVIFSGEVGYFFNKKFEMSIEIPYQIYSYTTIDKTGAGQYDLYYDSFQPSVMAYYVLSGTGYNFKFGGGIGPRFIYVTEEVKWQGTEDKYSSIGFGCLLRIEANTALSENLYANIGGDLRYDVNGEPEDNNGEKIKNIVNNNEFVNFNSFSVGIKLGISYLIGGTN
ncbi:MAG: hypothetical protein OEM46_00390 [Ignavibacteria bacterium]|nr:hypothetical protein [Ignavibacteria bacterium]